MKPTHKSTKPFKGLNLKELYRSFRSTTRFVIVTFICLLISFFELLGKKATFFKKISAKIKLLYLKLDTDRPDVISRGDLVNIALANLVAKKSRTYITIGGVMVGITTVVLLVSIGYGLQKMVVSKVARLDEMRQIDVYTQSGSNLKINDKTLSDIQDISGVEKVLPVIAVVGRVNYLKSVSDLAVFGVTTSFLLESAVQPADGKIFESNDISNITNQSSGEVRGVSLENDEVKIGNKIRDVNVTINNDSWLKIRSQADQKSSLLGYISSIPGGIVGEEYWGKSYLDDEGNGTASKDADGEVLGKWIKIKVPIYEKHGTDYLPGVDENNSPLIEEGYIAEIDTKITSQKTSTSTQVLGVTTTPTPTPQASVVVVKDGWVEIASESAVKESLKIDEVELSSSAKREAVVNRSMLAILGIKENEAINKEFSVSFVITGNLLEDNQKRLESKAAEYKIVGVTPDNKSAQFFVPFIDIRTLGVVNYSQAKVVVKNQSELTRIRKQIESLGYRTRSVVDTVNQINQLFSTLRAFLAILGMVALFVAAVGMFNTLTVSLMERTREVGLMKAMGMRSSEIKELFLAESLIMSCTGGILGIVVGILLSKIIELCLSIFSIVNGSGYVTVSYTPPLFGLGIIVLALIVGFVTGFYPSRRATKISALNALRYE